MIDARTHSSANHTRACTHTRMLLDLLLEIQHTLVPVAARYEAVPSAEQLPIPQTCARLGPGVHPVLNDNTQVCEWDYKRYTSGRLRQLKTCINECRRLAR